MAKEIRGKRLYDDGEWLLLKTTPFGINHWLLGSFYAGLHGEGLVAKSTAEEKFFLLSVLGELAKRGVRPPDDRLQQLFQDFAQVITVRGGARWQVFFRSMSAVEFAAEYASAEDI